MLATHNYRNLRYCAFPKLPDAVTRTPILHLFHSLANLYDRLSFFLETKYSNIHVLIIRKNQSVHKDHLWLKTFFYYTSGLKLQFQATIIENLVCFPQVVNLTETV